VGLDSPDPRKPYPNPDRPLAENQTPHLFCFGLGYTARRLARALLAEGWRVSGTVRGAEAAAALATEGIAAQPFARGRPLGDIAPLMAASYLLSSVPPDEAGDAVLDGHGADIAAHPGLVWAGYLSTTGVYGDRDGGWVDEGATLAPTGGRQRRRAAAEAGWLALRAAHGVKVHSFRLPGIYGPGRSAFDALRAGTAKRVVKPGLAFSRIHVDDIVQVLRASMARPDPGVVYNVCDDAPAPSADVTAHAAALLGVDAPPEIPLEDADLSPMARSFYADNKRVRNDRIKAKLGVTLRYPTYREGLAAILAEERGG
jgi:nucleoside-diphosphate-sugar epimerase